MKHRRSRALRRRYGHGRRKAAGPIRIIGAWITHYGDSGQVIAHVRWQKPDGTEGETSGSPNSLHMQAMLDRAMANGVRIKRETTGKVYGPGGSWVAEPHESIPARFQ